MAVKSFFSITRDQDEFESVQGWQISLHFSCRIEHLHGKQGKGYRITHTLSGFLLTDMGFSSLEVAKHFAEVCEAVFGKYLGRADRRILNDAAKADPACKSLQAVIKNMNELAKTKPVIGEQELAELLGESNGQ